MKMSRMQVTGKRTVSNCYFYFSRVGGGGGESSVLQTGEDIGHLPLVDDSNDYIMPNLTKLASSK